MDSVNIVTEEYSEQFKFEKTLEQSHKTLCIYFINESPGLNYGVGKHLEHLSALFSECDKYDFIIVQLKSHQSKPWFSFINEIPCYHLPFREGNNDVYYKSVFYYLMSRLKNKDQIILFFNYASQIQLAQNFRSVQGVKIVYIQHYMDWGIRFRGNINLFQEALKSDIVVQTQFANERNIMEISDIVIVSSPHSIGTLVRLYHIALSKIHLVPLSIDHEIKEMRTSDIRLKFGLRKDDRIISFVGRLDDNKGIESLIRAFSSIKQRESKLWIIGGGNIHEYLKLINNNNWDRIVFWGYRGREFINEIYSITEIGIVPSYYEEFGYSALEMMSRGIPVIVRKTSGLKDLVENGKWGDVFVEDSENINELISHIEYRLKNPYTAKQRNDLMEYVNEKYSFRHFKNKMHKIIDDLSF